MAFREEKSREQQQEARHTVRRLVRWLLIACLPAGYLTIGRALGFYDWRGGIISVFAIVIVATQAIPVIARWQKLRLGPKCPVCGGLFSVSEKTLRGSTVNGTDTLAAVVDRVSTCESCGREHHHVHAATGESGPMVPITLRDSSAMLWHNRRSKYMRMYPGKTDAEIDKLLAELDAMPQVRSMTRPEWEKLLEQLQQEARAKNREQGMELPRE